MVATGDFDYVYDVIDVTRSRGRQKILLLLFRTLLLVLLPIKLLTLSIKDVDAWW